MRHGVGRLVRGLGLLGGLLACGRERPPSSHDRGPPAAGNPAPSASAGTEGRGAGSSVTALRDPVPLTASVEAGGATAGFKGLGECHHTTDASIYEVPAAMWTTTVDAKAESISYLNLTLWQPKSGGDLQLSLAVTVGGTTHQLATVKGAPIRGSGSATVEPRGSGGVLTVRGTDAEGRAVHVIVECSTFTEPVAEGG